MLTSYGKIVDDISGVMDVPAERYVPMQGCDHRSICRFAGKDSESYKTVYNVLQDWVEELNEPCLQSLAFPEISYRRQEADKAFSHTCEWILQHRFYTIWLGGKRGLLWIKGKPGSGKSTLMAFIYRELQKNPPSKRSLTLDFFFHGRGAVLQKTPIGMFRSLLHQIYDKVPSVRSPVLAAFREKKKLGEAGSGWEWQRKELEDLFSYAVVRAAKSRTITIFVDALDEAGADTAKELAEYFQELNNQLAVGMSTAKICISLDVRVEDENKEDISVYVCDKLHKSLGTGEFKQQYLAELQDAIVERARGVFQWAVLVGCSTKEIRQLLDEVPEALGEVYEHILRKVIDKKDYPLTLRLMRWIRFAMGLPEKEILSPESSLAELELQPDDEMLKRIASLSGGLIESREHEIDQIVQFIHQSVNDFLLQDGLRIFDKTSGDLIGQGHHQIAETRFPFAETRGVAQDYLLHYTQFYRILDPYSSGRRPEQSSTMLHIASSAGLLSVVEDGNGNRALHHASRWGHTQVVKALLDAGADFQAENKSMCTALERAAANGHEEIVGLLLSKGANVNKQTGDTGNALYGAAAKGSRAVVQLLLNKQADINAQGGYFGNALQAAAYGADVNAQGGRYGNALQAAAAEGHQPIVQFLLDKQTNVNAQGGYFGNALQAAAYWADVNAQGGRFGNALQAAAYWADVNAQGGRYGNALQAAAAGAYVNAQGGHFGNALQAAAVGGHQLIVQLLLDKQADVNAQGGEFGNALQAAATEGHQLIVQLLLDKQADVNAQGGYFGNALQAAAIKGHQLIVQLLLDKQADLIDLVLSGIKIPDWTCQDLQGCSALHFAASGGSDQIVQVILESKVDINLACRNGSRKIVCMLREFGADSIRKDYQRLDTA
ncbi:ankyrin repeat-containing domain protein [Leptodontidium sp. MPI-SDFR-AT-0119]|nr:ankyrin repeat-containing domain protein [Leptodontidium sp. MPI-SDFR-AT-0119]